MAVQRENLIQFLGDRLGVDTDDLEDDTLIFSSGILDSFSIVDLIAYLEQDGGFKMSPTDVTLDNLDSIERIMKYCQTASASA